MKNYLNLRTFFYIFWVVLINSCGFVERDSDFHDLTKIKGMTLEAPSQQIDSAAFQPLHNLHVNAIAIVPYAFSRNSRPEVYFDNDHQWWGERIEGASKMTKIAHTHHFLVLIKPQVWMHHDWIGDFKLDREEDWNKWEKEYTAYIMAYAKMAEECNAEFFCIGTELQYAALNRPDYFRSLISDVREVYTGKITYAANWDSYYSITFWDDLDFIGVNAYFPLSQKDNPTLAELKIAWKPFSAELKQIHELYKKPVLITEFGYRSVDGAAGNQWELDANPVNDNLQAVAFKAFFETLYTEKWIAGVFVWKWEFQNRNGDYVARRDKRYTPQGKPASKVIAEYFSR